MSNANNAITCTSILVNGCDTPAFADKDGTIRVHDGDFYSASYANRLNLDEATKAHIRAVATRN